MELNSLWGYEDEITREKRTKFYPNIFNSQCCFVLLTLLLLIEVVNFARIVTISKTKASTLVELSDGESIRVLPLGSEERSPQAITRFVGQTMTGLLSWNALPKGAKIKQRLP